LYAGHRLATVVVCNFTRGQAFLALKLATFVTSTDAPKESSAREGATIMTLPRETLDNLFHLSTRDPLFIGHALAAQRQALRIGVDEQARRLGLSLELLARLALRRTLRLNHRAQDLKRVARFVGVTA
jgi:hypothetical protein